MDNSYGVAVAVARCSKQMMYKCAHFGWFFLSSSAERCKYNFYLLLFLEKLIETY